MNYGELFITAILGMGIVAMIQFGFCHFKSIILKFIPLTTLIILGILSYLQKGAFSDIKQPFYIIDYFFMQIIFPFALLALLVGWAIYYKKSKGNSK